MSSLFRQQAIEAQKQKLHGDVSLAQPMSIYAVTSILLDTFAQFLLSKDDDFKGPSKSPKISFNEVRGEAWHSVKNDLKQYKNSIPIQNSIVTECL